MQGLLRSGAVALVVFAVLCGPALAEKGDNNIRFGLQWVEPTGDFSEEAFLFGDLIDFELEAQSAVGAAFSYERIVHNKEACIAVLRMDDSSPRNEWGRILNPSPK